MVDVIARNEGNQMTNMTVAGYQFDPDMAMILAEKAAMVLGILIITWALAKGRKTSAAA